MSDTSDHPLFTTDDVALCVAYYHVIVPILELCCLLSMIPALYKYIATHKEKVAKSNHLYYWGLSLFVSIFLTFICQLIWDLIMLCQQHPSLQTIIAVVAQLYVLQNLLLQSFLFGRLYFAFSASALSLSKCAIRVWCIVMAITACTAIVAAIVYVNPQQWGLAGAAVIGSMFLMLFILTMYTNCMFIAKLFQVFKQVDEDKELKNVAIKTSLLASISTISFLMSAAITLIATVSPSFHMGFVQSLFAVNDELTNFWCTILSFQHFDECYHKICCHSRCSRMWMLCVCGRNEDEEAVCTEMQKSSSIA